jgi:hypothetical protein
LLDHVLLHEVNDDVLGQRRGLVGHSAIDSNFGWDTESAGQLTRCVGSTRMVWVLSKMMAGP